MRVLYGSLLEKTLLSGGFLLASAACLLLLATEGLLLARFLGLAAYLAASGLILAAIPRDSRARRASSKQLYRFLPLLFLAGGIGLASSLPMTPDSSLRLPDYLLHGLEFAALGLLTVRAVESGWPGAGSFSAFLLAFFLSLGFGGLDEFHQNFVPGRDPSLVDLASDGAGILVGLLIYRILYRPSTGPLGQRRPAPRNRSPDADR